MKRSLVALGLFLVFAGVVAIGFHHHDSSTTTTTTTTSSTTTSTSTSTTTSTIAQAIICTSVDLTGAYVPGQGAAGTVYALVTLTNTSSEPCTVDGWPSLTIYNGANVLVPSTVTESSSFFNAAGVDTVPAAPSLLTIEPGSMAQFNLSYSDVPVGSQSSCPSVTTIKVALLGHNVVVQGEVVVTANSPGPISPCGVPAQLTVSPIYS